MDAIQFTVFVTRKMKLGERKPRKEPIMKSLNERYLETIGCEDIVYFGTEDIQLDVNGKCTERQLSLMVRSVAVLAKPQDALGRRERGGRESVSIVGEKKRRLYDERKQCRLELAKGLGSLIATAVGGFFPEIDSIPAEIQINYSVEDSFMEKHKDTEFCKHKSMHEKYAHVEEDTFVFEYTRPETLDDLLSKLEVMPGLKEAKNVISQMITLKQIETIRTEAGMKNTSLGSHCVLLGNPGTAKTTFAMLLAKIMASIGIVKTNKFFKVSRKDLTGQYIGESEQKVKALVEKARGGVVFIDEAYSLFGEGKDYGVQVVAELVDAMESYRDDTVFIFAGYKDEMQKFIDMNPGLRSRISFTINFPDYTNDELWEIMNLLAKERSYTIDTDVQEKIVPYFDILRNSKGFGNGRTAREMVEKAIMQHSYRIINSTSDAFSPADLEVLTADDFKEPKLEEVTKPQRIGFC